MTRFGYVMVTGLSATAIGVSALVPVTPWLLWNASASAPVGLYLIQPDEHLEVPDLVAIVPPAPLAHMLEQRGYLPLGVPLLKRIVALPGQRVCRNGRAVTVDGIATAEAKKQDLVGRALPVWQGCRRIADGEVFLLNWQHPDSLDSRYVGPLPRDAIIGRATPLFTDEAGDDHLEWRAPVRRAPHSRNRKSTPKTMKGPNP
ncbi:conjugative transfer signal peptidase TraF [Rhodobium orientis]|uniref:S26 family signal peptidase n=1 Tax=Rhodobium orientis TaxID=34017 RepID=A0A327JMG4_9HYPH|nr:S26 family signal peptidase [Rhodobium orientis]MBB4303140.1 conjugative transfer signal peptidase TraF [Rhodobium orientis]MBK5951758.1 S26 family signal peptidase [Rhodobium orientis]RAI26935.1 S26 family signal peptidase [Rhodobium orientis]